jgi:dual specificity phosphatase 12
MVDAQQIVPHLYLGSIRAATDPAILEHLKIKTIISVCPKREFGVIGANIPNGYTVYHLELDDSDTQWVMNEFDYICVRIDDYIKRRQNVLVHCFAGISRSATFVIAYVMKAFRLSTERAYELVKSKRHIINPNPGFVLQLQLYSLMGCTTHCQSLVNGCRNFWHLLYHSLRRRNVNAFSPTTEEVEKIADMSTLGVRVM